MLLQHAERNGRAGTASSCVTVTRNCVMQMAHYVVATRLERRATRGSGSWDTPRSSLKEIGCCCIFRHADYLPRLWFVFICSPHTFAITREFHRAGKSGGDIDHGNKPCFISRKIYLPRGTYQRGTKIRGEDMMMCIMLALENPGDAWVLKVSRDSSCSESVLTIYIYTPRRKRERRKSVLR